MDTHDRAHTPVETEKEPIASIDDVAKPLDTFGKIVFLVIVVEIVLMAGLNLYQKSRIDSLTATLQTRQDELKSPEFATLNKQVEEVLLGSEKLASILASKTDWTVFYRKLNEVTPKNVRLSTINITDTGSFKADGETASLSSLAVALVAWKQGTDNVTTPFSNLTLTSNGFTSDGAARRVTFSVSGQVDFGRIQ